jgi:hypothetical protein
MALWVDRKFLMLVSSRLRNFKEKGSNLFNFSCPFCGDSQRNKIRARGYIYERSGKLKYSCHNCGLNSSFGFFLKKVDPNSYKEFSYEKFKELGQRKISVPKKETEPSVEYNLDIVSRLLLPLGKLPKNHEALNYVLERRIPVERWRDLYYVDNFKEYITNTYDLDPRRISRLVEDDPRLVMFLTDLSGKVTHVNARSIRPNSYQRYVKLKVVPQQIDRKIFGLQYVDFTKRIYVLEGEIDSMFLRNAVASGDSSLNQLGCSLKLKQLKEPDVVLVFDNEPRNKDIMRQLKESIEVGHQVVIWPDNWLGKDINEMIKDHGKSPEQVQRIIAQNTFKGLEALLMFSDWSKR